MSLEPGPESCQLYGLSSVTQLWKLLKLLCLQIETPGDEGGGKKAIGKQCLGEKSNIRTNFNVARTLNSCITSSYVEHMNKHQEKN